jgi:chromosome segregation ATPase
MSEARALAPIVDPLAALRARLREIIARVAAEQQRLGNLEGGQSRAHEQLREANHKRSDAQDALRRAEQNEPARLAEQFVNGETHEDPVGDASAILTAARAEVDRLEKIEAALTGEISRSQATLSTLRVTQFAIMAEIVFASDEYKRLIAAHRDAWRALRSVKEALRAV